MIRRFSPDKVAKRRRVLGKTQMRLSREIGISQVSISAIEKGKKQPRSGTLARLATALDCTVDSFFRQETNNS